MPKLIRFLFAILFFSLASGAAQAQPRPQTKGEYYQITIYHASSQEQVALLDAYLEKALLPALHKSGMKQVGVFKPHGFDTMSDKKIYVVAAGPSLDFFAGIPSKLMLDKDYQKNGASFLGLGASEPGFARMENIFLRSFRMAPRMKTPSLKGQRSERVYELRSYESPSEAIFQNKVEMFNEGGEVALFARLGFNAVFYGEVLSGSRMPNLMYMTTFENKTERDAHWKAFGADPEWKELSARPNYQKNVSKIDQYYLFPTPYSDY